MAIEIIPKKDEKKEPSFKNNVYNIGLALLFFLFFSTIVLFFIGLRSSNEAKSVDNLIKEQFTGEIMALENKIEKYYKKTDNLPVIIQRRRSFVSFLEKVEDIMHPLVFFSEFEANVTNNSINAVGVALNIVAFDQQIKILKESDSVVSFSVQDFNVQEDKTVEFPITIVFK